MDFHLHVEAEIASHPSLQITGRDAAVIGNPADNLVLTTYQEVLTAAGVRPPFLALRLHNEIPLGMGCGSSAAALVAGVALANQVGELGWNAQQVLTEAARREGHPDNVAACVLGGFTTSAMRGDKVDAVTLTPTKPWRLLLVLPGAGLSTKMARGLLPETYSRADAVANVQNVALLTAAFATGREELLRKAMGDRLHQPYRAAVCPLLGLLLPLAGHSDVLGVALSGAGPSVLLIVREAAETAAVEAAVTAALANALPFELRWTNITGSALLSYEVSY